MNCPYCSNPLTMSQTPENSILCSTCDKVWLLPSDVFAADLAVDSKYGKVITQNKKFHAGEPVFIFRATDPTLLDMLEWYSSRSWQLHCSLEFLAGIRSNKATISKWQKDHPELVKERPD